jgi:hypothetical protein
MTTRDSFYSPNDRLIDRIVDGELHAAELQTAITQFDQEPGAWRRCALAFLEAQAFKESMRALSPPIELRLQPEEQAVTVALVQPRIRSRIRTPIAASIIAASFALGWAGHAVRSRDLLGPATAAPATVAGKPSTENLVRLAGDHTDLTIDGDDRQGRFPNRNPIPAASRVVHAVARFRVGARDDGAEVPILAGPGINEQWLKDQPPPLDEYGQVALRQQGYQVDQSRQMFTTTLNDGRRVAIPIDQVQIRYTGNSPL